MKYEGRIVDSHIHIRGGFGELDEFIKGMDRLRADSGCGAVAIAAVPLWDAECVGQNVISLMQKAAYPGVTFVLAGFDYHMPRGYERDDFLQQARRFMDMGCDGVKMLEGKPNVRKLIGNIPLNSELYEGFYAWAEKEQVPILLHAADPETFWHEETLPAFARNSGWGYADGTFAPKEQICAEVEDVLARHPHMKMSLAHFYFVSGDIERAAMLLDAYPNLSLDITPGTEMFADFSAKSGEWRDFFTRYSRRILFGTDNGWGAFTPMADKIARAREFVETLRRFLETSDEFQGFTGFGMPLKGLNLDAGALADIYADNFGRFASVKPRKLDMERVTAYTRKMRDTYRGADMPSIELTFPQMEECLERFRNMK